MFPHRIFHGCLIADSENTLRPKCLLHKIIHRVAVKSRSQRSSRLFSLNVNVQSWRRQEFTECAVGDMGDIRYFFELSMMWRSQLRPKEFSESGMYFQGKIHHRLQIRGSARKRLVQS